MSRDTIEHIPADVRERPLNMDERVLTLFEVNVAHNGTDNGKGQAEQHHHQVIIVRRGDYECKFVKDMGLAALSGNQFQFPCLGLYSVGEALEIADRLR